MVTTTPGSQQYLDLFPSVQLKYSIGDRSDVRVAVTRGIARPNYIDLAPHLSGTICDDCKRDFGNLVGRQSRSPAAARLEFRPSRRKVFDARRFDFGRGVLQADHRLHLRPLFIYQGPVTDFDGYLGTRPENGGNATLKGTEMSYTQRLYMLPGALAGLGVDVNWTHTDSRAELLADTASTAAGLGHPTTRFAALPRQAENVANLAGTYELGRVSARLAWQYQGASIYSSTATARPRRAATRISTRTRRSTRRFSSTSRGRRSFRCRGST